MAKIVSSYSSTRQNVVLPDGLTSIGKYAFRYCDKLSSINIPDGVTTIGSYAFRGCSKLNEIVIPNSVTNIGESAFYGCIGLTSMTIPGSVASISNNTFYNCEGLTSVTIPYGVKEIGENAFFNCRQLECITLPSSLTVIGNKAFDGYSTVSPIKTIVSYMEEPVSLPSFFGGDMNKIYKATVYIPFGTTETYKATEGWSNFINFVEMDEEQEEPDKPEPEIPVYEDGEVFTAETVEGVKLRYTVISAEDKTCMLGVTEPVEGEWEPSAYTDGNYYHGAVNNYASFTLTLPEEVNGLTVVGIGDNALGNSTLSDCNIPSTVKWIGDRAFYNTNISEFVISASVTSIGWNVIESITLHTISVEEGNTIYDSRNNCNAIIETATNTLIQGCNGTTIPDGIEGIGYWSLACADEMTELNIPKSVTRIGVMGIPNLETITIDEENPVYDSRDNCNAIIETATNTMIIGCKNTIIPETVVAIGDEAFENTSLESIFVPGSVKSIGSGAFYCVNLKEATLAEGVEYIGESSFMSNGKLETITIPSTVTHIGANSFAYCSYGKTVISYITEPFGVSGVFRYFGSEQEETTTLYVPYGTKAKYEVADGWDVFDRIVEMGDVSVTLTKDMVTFATDMPLDFSTPVEGLSAYVVTTVNDEGKALLKEVNGAIPGGTGLILLGTTGQTYTLPCATTATAMPTNLLVGVTTDTAIGGDGTEYILKDGKFVKANAGTLSGGKAYLKLDAANAREVIFIDTETTGISTAIANSDRVKSEIYNLNGQRVTKPQQKGVYIVNGKKVIKK